MLVIALGALWLGGLFFSALCVAVAFVAIWEWWGLVSRFAVNFSSRALWMAAGALYLGMATALLVSLRASTGFEATLLVLAMVWATDIGAYLVGRTFGGPKIAPKISPSKTWSGLVGGMVAAGAIGMTGASLVEGEWPPIAVLGGAIIGALTAIVAQTGDFFQSWMKRRANVKDSGKLIPGHGGVFDRVDGLIAVMFVWSIVVATIYAFGINYD
jgi:phosphatidate cytidylyltransferase